MSAPPPDTVAAVRAYLGDFQDRLCAALEGEEPSARFRGETVETPGGGVSRPRVLSGEVIEKAAVHFSDTRGKRLPQAASERRPELAGRAYAALSVSTIVHPLNPYAPTSHMNVRFFTATDAESSGSRARAPIWWFGGGFDLTPYYGFRADAVAWHRAAAQACASLGGDAYPEMKKACDEYFFLHHRGEPRGIGGIFFDDLNEAGFTRCFDFVRAVADGYLEAYLPILRLRKGTRYGERERRFQLLRRGRYAEFNLIWDRGTRFGLEAGGRVESILASMPPLVAWEYEFQPEPGTPESQLYEEFLPPRDWLALDPSEGLS